MAKHTEQLNELNEMEWKIYADWVTGNPGMVKHFLVDACNVGLAPDSEISFERDDSTRKLIVTCAGARLNMSDPTATRTAK